MVGLRGLCWAGCWALLALACGRTNSDPNVTSNGARSGSGGTGSGVATTGGSGPTSHGGNTGQAGEIAAAGAAAECPVIPITGRWVAFGPDPYGFEFRNDGSSLSGEGCLGGLPQDDLPAPFGCAPINVLADNGRSLELVWDAGPAVGSSYVVKMQLTLSPERNAMAGKMWSSYAGNSEGFDIVLVPYPDEPILPATSCSGGEPSGECFLAPLRSDRLSEPRIVELAGGDLLMLWLNQRGIGRQIAATRFDAASGTWQAAEFLDDGSASVASLQLSTSAQGWAMAVYTQGDALLARAYSPKTKAWSKQQVLHRAKAADQLHPNGLFVHDGGDATLLASTQPVDGGGSLSAHDYSASTGSWATPHVLEDSPENAYQWAAGSDATRRELVVWVRGGRVDKPHELWFSSRSWPGPWSAPALFFSSDKQILRPALAISKDGTAVVTWQEWTQGINSSSYSFEGAAWSAPTMVTTETQRDNRVVRFDDTGAAVAYFHAYDGVTGELKSVLADGLWGPPQACTEMEVNGETYALAAGTGDLDVEQVVPGQLARSFPSLERPRCEGY